MKQFKSCILPVADGENTTKNKLVVLLLFNKLKLKARKNQRGMKMKEKKGKPLHGVFSNIVYVARDIWKLDKKIIIFVLLQIVAGVALPALSIFLPKLVIDEIQTAPTAGRIVMSIGLVSLAIVAFRALASYAESGINAGCYVLQMKYGFTRTIKMMDCDYSFIESATGQTKFHKANESSRYSNVGARGIVRSTGPIAAAIIGFILYSGIIGILNPLVVVFLTVSSALHYFVIKSCDSYIHKNKDNWAPIDKKLGYVKMKSAEFSNGKDIRLYNMKSWFSDNFNRFIEQRIYWRKKVAKREYLNSVSDAAVILIRDGFAYFYLIFAVLSGDIGVSDFVLLFGAIAGFSSFVTSIISSISEINRSSLYMCDIREFMETQDTSRKAGGRPVPMGEPSIEFKNVCFSYDDGKDNGNAVGDDGEGKCVLDHFNLTIKAGEKLAIVGVNGAGKTTLIKLLCGFYKPQSGEILLNGIPLGEFNRDDVFALFSAVFQDMLILPLSIAENIALCEPEKIDRKRVFDCLRLAGLEKRLPDIDVRLFKEADESAIELSGGETQKLIMARALYKNAPIMLLDEPTSALDPIAESEVYQKYNELTIGKTAIFISHRLASTRFCDRIIFIKDGAVFEEGTHEELVMAGEGYAEMFEIQSHYYKDEAVKCERKDGHINE